MDLLTISSWDSITEEREPRFAGLFPDEGMPRARVFQGKKVQNYKLLRKGFRLMNSVLAAGAAALFPGFNEEAKAGNEVTGFIVDSPCV